MLDEVVFAVADVATVWLVAGPPFQVSMSLILVAYPVGFALERFRLGTVREGTSEWLDILVNVLGPVRRLAELLGLEADGALELGW